MKKCKIRDYLLSYVAYITILGSISTIFVPDSCYVNDILVNIHTMVLHYGSFVVSMYLLMSGEVKINLKQLKQGVFVFLAFASFANLLNILMYESGILMDDTFNMFYISPYFISELPIFNVIQENVPYVVFLLTYLVALSLGGFIIYEIAKVCNRIYCKIHNRKLS